MKRGRKRQDARPVSPPAGGGKKRALRYVVYSCELLNGGAAQRLTLPDGTVLTLSPGARLYLMSLMNALQAGQTVVEMRQDSAALRTDRSSRQARRYEEELERFGLLRSWRTYDLDGRVNGKAYDLTGYLLLLPEKTLKAMRVAFILGTKMAGSYGRFRPEQPDLGLDAPEASDAPETAPSGAGGGENPPVPAEGAPDTYRTDPAGLEQEHAMHAIQHSARGADDGGGEGEPETEWDRTLSMLQRPWPDKSRLDRKQALRCLQKRGVAVCLDQLEALPYRKPKSNWAGMLRSSILENKDGWEAPPPLKASRAAAEKAAARAAKAAAGGKSRRVPSTAAGTGPTSPAAAGAAAPSSPSRKPNGSQVLAAKAHVPAALQDPWERALALLRELSDAGRFNEATYETHVRLLVPVRFVPPASEGDRPRLVLVAPGEFVRGWADKRLRGPLAAAWEDALGLPKGVRLRIDLPLFDEWVRGPDGPAAATARPEASL